MESHSENEGGHSSPSLQATLELVFLITQEERVINANRICACSVDSGSSTLDIIELFFCLVVFSTQELEVMGKKGRFRYSFGLSFEVERHVLF